MAVERPCRDCVWHSEDGCFVWDCDPITRQELADARRKAKEIDKQIGDALLLSFAKEHIRRGMVAAKYIEGEEE